MVVTAAPCNPNNCLTDGRTGHLIAMFAPAYRREIHRMVLPCCLLVGRRGRAARYD